MQRSPLFGSLPEVAREELVGRMERLEFPSGALLFQVGDSADRVYVIESGEVEVWVRRATVQTPRRPREEGWQPSPHEALVARLGPGEIVGEMALIVDSARNATVRAASDLVAYALSEAPFREALARHRGLRIALEDELRLRAAGLSLAQSGAFSRLPPEAFRWLAPRLQPRRFDSGEEILHEGAPADALYLLQGGSVEVVHRRRDGGEDVLNTLAAGDVFGEQGLLAREPRNATVRALEPVDALRLAREDVEEVLRFHEMLGTYLHRLALRRQRPCRIEPHVVEELRGRDGRPVFVVKDPLRHRYAKLSEEGAFLWSLMDGDHTMRDLTMALQARFGRFDPHSVMRSVLDLSGAGFVHIQEVGSLSRSLSPRLGPGFGHRALRLVSRSFATSEADGAITWLHSSLVRPLYRRPVQAAVLVLTLAGGSAYAVTLVRGDVTLPTTAGLVVAATLLALTVHTILHELAHAITCKHFGREVHRLGVGWYLFFPVAFADTSDMWLTPKLPRIAVTVAGPYTNFALSGIAMLLTLPVDGPAEQVLFAFATYGYVVGLANLNPLVELDGYYVLIDVLDVSNLRSKALAFLGAIFWRAGRTTRERRLVRLFAAYGALAFAYVFVVIGLILFVYQRYVKGSVSHLTPDAVATALGWVIAGAMAALVVVATWGELRRGVDQARTSADRG